VFSNCLVQTAELLSLGTMDSSGNPSNDPFTRDPLAELSAAPPVGVETRNSFV
jgi:hypothetical protein